MKINQWISMSLLVGISLIGIEGYGATLETREKDTTEGMITYTTAIDTKLRKVRGTDTPILLLLEPGTPVLAKEAVGNWYQVEYEGQTGYIYNSQIETEALDLLPKRVQEVVPSKGEQLVSYAKQFLGNPYRYAGNSLTSGVDCSGFTTQIYKKFGYQLQRSSRAQYANNGYKVNQNELLPGDLVFYGRSGVVDHVAIYAGNNQIIHANSPSTGIIISKLNYGKPMIGFKRMIQ